MTQTILRDGVVVEVPNDDPDAQPPFVEPPPPTRTATGKQIRYALNDLGLRSAWEAAVAKANQGTQDYWSCCGSDAVPETNTKIGKLCAAVGTTAAALFDRAVAE